MLHSGESMKADVLTIRRYRAIFISDVHLGTRRAQAAALPDFPGHRFGHVAVMREAVYRSASGRRYLILHGDKFDNVIYFAPWLAKLGDWAYERLMDLNGPVNFLRRVLGFGKWSLSAYMKHKVKKAVEFISRFEEAVVREAHARGCEGVICGHIHTPDNRMIGG